jgi:uncharacterized surface protein with fasciclin (FAS1) repeats
VLPAGTVENLLKPENKDQLTAVLTYHVVAGRWDAQSIRKQIKANGGEFKAKTVQGGWVTFRMNGDNLMVGDARGGWSNITISNVWQSNGVIHVIDRVLLP